MQFYMDVAIEASRMSPAVRKKVGCVIVKNQYIVSTGYNHIPTHLGSCENVTDSGELVTKPELIHAEMHAIQGMVKNGISFDESELYVTMLPCMECAKLVYAMGIKTVIYLSVYRSIASIKYLKSVDICVDELDHKEGLSKWKSYQHELAY